MCEHCVALGDIQQSTLEILDAYLDKWGTSSLTHLVLEDCNVDDASLKSLHAEVLSLVNDREAISRGTASGPRTDWHEEIGDTELWELWMLTEKLLRIPEADR